MTNETKSLPVYIIGDTPLAYYLAAKLTLAEENICLLGNNETILETGTICIKENARAKKVSVSVRMETFMHHPARLVIFCAGQHKIKSGLLFASKAKTANCPTVNFSGTECLDLMKNALNEPIVPAYFNGWITAEEEDVFTLLNAGNGITLSLSEQQPDYKLISEILNHADIPLSLNQNDLQNFWNNFIPYAAGSLFSVESKSSFRAIAKKATLRQTFNQIMDELISVSPESLQIDKNDFLNNLYQTPENYKYPVMSKNKSCRLHELNRIEEILRNQPAYTQQKLPIISDIISRKITETLSSVEE